MHKTFDITLDNICKIEGNAELKVKIVKGEIKDIKLIISDFRRLYTEAVKGKPFQTVPQILARICGTCSFAHLFCSIEAVEKALGIYNQITEQTMIFRKLVVNGMMIRDHALHLYIFSLPDLLGIDSVLDIDEKDEFNHQLLHDAFDIKALGNDLNTVFAGAVVHAAVPTVGGFLKMPAEKDFSSLIQKLENSREKVLRIIKVFYDWKEVLERDTDYMALISKDFNFLEGYIQTSNETFKEEKFKNLLDEVIIPYSQSKGYKLKKLNEEYLVGALARLNINSKALNPRTLNSVKEYISVFPSKNIFHNNLAQAIEILHCIDSSIDTLSKLKVKNEKPIQIKIKAGKGVGVVEAPRGILYHKVELDEKGIVIDCDVIVPTSQNQIHIEKSLKEMIQTNLDKMNKEELRIHAEQIIRAYDPCMSCATNFLKINWIE